MKMRQKKLYKPGDNIGYRLGKDDQDLADFINSHDSVGDLHKLALRLFMEEETKKMTANLGAHPNENLADKGLLDLNIKIDKLRQDVQLIVTEISRSSQRSPSVELHDENAATVLEEETTDEDESEEIKEVLDNLMDF